MHELCSFLASPSPNVPWQVTVLIGCGFGFFATIAIVWIAYKLDSPKTLNFALCIFGGALGWVVGILVSPYSGEASRFSEYGKGISTLLSGYALAKLGQLLNIFVADPSKLTNAIITRAILFLSSFFVFVLLVFVTRSYITTP